MKVGYRAGDLNRKSDTLVSYFGGGRSTGYHGSGFYFVRNVDEILISSYNLRPLYKLTFKDNVRWFYGDKYSHDILKKLHNYVYQYDYISNFKELESIYKNASYVTEYTDELVKVIRNSYESVKDEYADFLDWLKDKYNKDILIFINSLNKLEITQPIYKQFQRAEPDWDLLKSLFSDLYFIFDRAYIKSLDQLIHDVELRVPVLFDISLQRVKDFAKRTFEYVQLNKESTKDSVVTVFLKELGFDGVWPDNEIDNTYYGGVVFEKDSIRKIEKLSETVKDFKG